MILTTYYNVYILYTQNYMNYNVSIGDNGFTKINIACWYGENKGIYISLLSVCLYWVFVHTGGSDGTYMCGICAIEVIAAC